MVSGGSRVPALYLIRHGEPAVAGVLLGQTDPPLSPRGREQMAAVRIDAAVVYASPLRRARESAELLGQAVVILPELAEIGLGEWDGLSWSEIETRDPELASRKLADWTGVTPPGGETWSDFTRRVDSALEVVRRGLFPAAVVAHVAVNAWIAHRVGRAATLAFQQEYAQVDRYEL
jgi:broad specificity phosphatase PhoE